MHPISLLWRNQVPNCLKVLIILEELEIPYESRWFTLDTSPEDQYDEDTYSHFPSIHDPNTNIFLFESNAIIHYLITTYDTSHILSYPSSSPLTYEIMQWTYFQASGQGSYSSQFYFSSLPHAEKPRSTDSSNDEGLLYTLGLIEQSLHDDYLLGKKCTWADLAFLPWLLQIDFLLQKMKNEDGNEVFLEVSGWQARMLKRYGVKRALGKAASKKIQSD